MKFLRHLFGPQPDPLPVMEWSFTLTEQESVMISHFKKLPQNDRIRQMMTTGDSGDTSLFALLRYGILEDADIHVRSAALKRIHLFSHHPDVLPLLQTLREAPLNDTMEPYLTMTLHRLKLIGKEELERRINASRHIIRENN